MQPIRKIAPIKSYGFVGVSLDISVINSVHVEYRLIELPIRTNKNDAPSNIGGSKRGRVVVIESITAKIRIVKTLVIYICLLINYARGEISHSRNIGVLLRIINNESAALALTIGLLRNVGGLGIGKNTETLVFVVGGIPYPMIARETFFVRYRQVCNSYHFGRRRFFRRLCGIRAARKRENKDKKQDERPKPN